MEKKVFESKVKAIRELLNVCGLELEWVRQGFGRGSVSFRYGPCDAHVTHQGGKTILNLSSTNCETRSDQAFFLSAVGALLTARNEEALHDIMSSLEDLEFETGKKYEYFAARGNQPEICEVED